MRLASLLVVPTIALWLGPAAVGTAEAAPEAASDTQAAPDASEAAGFDWDPVATETPDTVDVEVPASAETSESADAPTGTSESVDAPTEAPTQDGADAKEPAGVTLGPVGYDSQGRPGRIHVVVRGDTLWDVSEAYLATPWVWPSIWQDNDAIENPHLIYPGDHIWITPTEMRKVTPEEAEQLLAGRPASEPPPASLGDAQPEVYDVPAKLRPVSALEMIGVVSPEQLEGAASIVDSPHERVWLGQHDTVFVGLGEGEVEPQDQFTIFRVGDKVIHPETRHLVGYHVEILGWLEVTKINGETSEGMVEQSYAELRRGDRLLPRQPAPSQVEVLPAPQSVEGQLLFMPHQRTQAASADFVFLDRGAADGLAVGNPVEVYRPGREELEPTKGHKVRTPDWVVAKALVLSTEEETAVGLVTHSTAELERGDLFRTTSDDSLR